MSTTEASVTSTPIDGDFTPTNTSEALTPMDEAPDNYDLFGDDPPTTPPEECAENDIGMIDLQKAANFTLGAKHLRSLNSTPLSSPSRDRTKRPRAGNFHLDDSEDESKLIAFIRLKLLLTNA